MNQPLELLMAEDNPRDAEMILRELRRGGFTPNYTIVDTEEAFRAQLHPGLDLILSDYAMPQFDGLRALGVVREHGLDTPFILISGTIGEEIAVTAMRRGATDYLLKDRLSRLPAAVSHAIAQNRLRRDRVRMTEELQLSEQRFRALVEASAQIVWTSHADGSASEATESWYAFTGMERVPPAGAHWLSAVHPDDRPMAEAAWLHASERSQINLEYRLRHFSGEWRWMDVRAVSIRDAQGRVSGWIGMSTDIHERKATAALLEGQRNILEMIATGRPLPETLAALARLVEGQGSGLLCAFFLLDASGMRLRPGVGPSLPTEFLNASAGLEIGATGAKAPDPGTDPAWAAHRDLALGYGLRGCALVWIPDPLGRPLGILGTYHPGTVAPDPAHLRLVEAAADTAAIAICRERGERRIKEQLEELLRWQEVMLDREDRVQALKAEVNELLARVGEPTRYSPGSP